ncbi:FadR/GntR family transcriptional regulator [Streptomyces sp. NPDC056231]|uniref:FadR/GntR family transcriptional regulator n=1 Tax=Streptomyces sp. NPDC056231 TaxID=3345755 RepID=UPI003AACDF5C
MNRDKPDARRAVFTPVDTLARVEAVVRRLGDAIDLGLLADGEQLPGETDLAAQLGVSTVTLREALMALRQQGLVTTRRGRGGGSFVTVPNGPAEDRLLARLSGWSTEELRDLSDHWAAVSGAAARLAAQRTEPEDLQQLQRSLGELVDAEDLKACSRIIGRFHVELAAAAQSARLTREEVTLQTEVGALLPLALGENEHLKDIADRHRAVVTAVHDGADDRARALAEQSVQAAMSRLIEIRLGSADGPRPKEGPDGQQSPSRKRRIGAT